MGATLRALGVAGLCAMVGPPAAAVRLTSAEPGNVFVMGSRVVLRIEVPGASSGLWQVRAVSYGGTEAANRTVRPPQPVDLGPLPAGYYDVTAVGPAGATASAPVVVVARTRLRASSPIGVDAAHAWLLRPEQLDAGARMIRLAGVPWIRERIAWGEVERQRGSFVWTRYDAAVDAARRQGLRIVQVFHSSPGWSRADGDTARYPDDPRDAFRFGEAAARHFRGRVQAWEVWNEADIPHFSVEPASEYAAFLKAVARGLKRADPRIPVTQVSYALQAELFADLLYRNGAAAYFDVFNYHIYAQPAAFPARAQGHFDLLDRHRVPRMPVWLTEAGLPLPVAAALSDEQKRQQAEFVPKSYVMSLASGTDRHFFFVFPHYVEGGSWFGLLDPDMRPYPGYAALATVARLLGSAEYAGRPVGDQPPGLQSHLFETPRGQVLVVWSDGDPVRLTVPRGDRPVRVVDIVGADVPMATRGPHSLTVASSPLYLLLPRGTLRADGWRAAARREAGRRLPPGLPDVVVRWLLPKDAVRKARELYELPANAATPARIQVANLGRGPVSGRLELRTDGAEPLLGSIAVEAEPMGLATFDVPRTLRRLPVGGKVEWTALVVETGGRRSSAPAVVDVAVDPATLGVASEVPLPMAAGATWDANPSPAGRAQVSGLPGAGEMRLRVEFPGAGDRWCYPRAAADGARWVGAHAITFEYRTGPEVSPDTLVRVQCVEEGGSGYFTPVGLPPSLEWRRAVVQFADLAHAPWSTADPDRRLTLGSVRQLLLGVNTTGGGVTLEVRRLQLLTYHGPDI
ncbi:MAG TPA: hypothetical protein VLH79_03060 [Chthonomonadales bacterium]|nr:hypothetical protein [Chthonomonadales bacterium]